MQWALGVNTGRPAVAAAATLATLVSGLALSWEAADVLCGTSVRCSAAMKAAARGVRDHLGVDLDQGLLWAERAPGAAWASAARAAEGHLGALPALLPWSGAALPPWAGGAPWRVQQPGDHRSSHGPLQGRGPLVAATMVGVLLFAGLGGRALSLAPSNVRHLGAFARSKVSATAAHAILRCILRTQAHAHFSFCLLSPPAWAPSPTKLWSWCLGGGYTCSMDRYLIKRFPPPAPHPPRPRFRPRWSTPPRVSAADSRRSASATAATRAARRARCGGACKARCGPPASSETADRRGWPTTCRPSSERLPALPAL